MLVIQDCPILSFLKQLFYPTTNVKTVIVMPGLTALHSQIILNVIDVYRNVISLVMAISPTFAHVTFVVC